QPPLPGAAGPPIMTAIALSTAAPSHMKIALLSDLHLSMAPLPLPPTDADVVVLARALGPPAAAIEWARQYAQPTLFVAGNHEYYGSDLVSALAELRARAAGSAVQ